MPRVTVDVAGLTPILYVDIESAFVLRVREIAKVATLEASLPFDSIFVVIGMWWVLN